MIPVHDTMPTGICSRLGTTKYQRLSGIHPTSKHRIIVFCVNMGSAFIDHGKAKPDAGTLITKWQVATGRSSRICFFRLFVT